LVEGAADRDHLAMRGRVAIGAPEVAPEGEHFSVTDNHCAERKVRDARLLQRHAHEALVIGCVLRGRRRGEKRSGQRSRGDAGAAGQNGSSTW